MLKKHGAFVLLGLISLFAVSVQAEVKLPAVLSSNMVIQRDMPAPFWGWADPGEAINLSGSWGASVQTVADADGRWMVKLPAPKAGGPFTITVQGQNKIVLTNILSGDVWICSGQSNMNMAVRGSINSAKEISDADYPNIRLFQVNNVTSQTSLDDTEGQWQSCSPETVGRFSATGYFFGRKLHRELNVPIGLVQSAWGGTPIVSWISADAQQQDPRYIASKKHYDNQARTYTPEKAKADYQLKLEQWEIDVAQWREDGSKGIKPYKPSRPLPHPLNDNPKYPGVLYNAMIHPVVPLGIKGAIWYQGEANAGGFAAHYRVQLETLITSWRNAWGQGDFPFYFVQLPNYDSPWTQPVEDGGWPIIREVFMNVAKEVPNTAMAITIDIGDAKNIHPNNKQDVGDRLARLALYNNYGMKDIIWTGPIYKACRFEGNQAIITFETGNAPLAIKGDQLKGFAIIDSQGTPFAADATIQGDDTVVVSSPEVTEALGVYYAWAINPVGANLMNEAGLPASPFRFGKLATDSSEAK
jgi:sialate O-acetylesterase